MTRTVLTDVPVDKPAHYYPFPVTKPHRNDVEDEDSSDEENDEPPVTMCEFKTQPDKPRIIDVEDRDNNEKETDEPPTPMCEFGKSPVKPQIIDMDDDDSVDKEEKEYGNRNAVIAQAVVANNDTES